jgi:3-deoxy-D-manno-octulosonic-acid transferase
MKQAFNILYNFIFLPLFYILLKIGGLFNKKIRTGIEGRKRIYEKLILNATSINKTKKLVWFHSSSLGEFEQAKPIIEQLKKEKDVNVLITFFSPSGYVNSIKYPFADLISYIPFDTKANADKFISVTNPSLAIVMRYDIWPNIIESLNRHKIPVYLVDATLRSDSLRLKPLLKQFHKIIFGYLTRILTVSETDAKHFKYFGLTDKVVKAVGDTRFDRVYQRSVIAKDKQLISETIIKNKKVFVAGSTWEQDEEVILPAFIKAAQKDESCMMIIAPHEPTLLHLEKLENEFVGKINCIRFSHLNNYKGEKIIIVDSIGILLTLYTYAHFAFVGGSFKQNIHNVLEAAVYGIPVMYGPKIDNSQEVKKMNQLGAGIMIKNKKDAYRNIRKLFEDEDFRKAKGVIAFNYVNESTGATKKILDEIKIVL